MVKRGQHGGVGCPVVGLSGGYCRLSTVEARCTTEHTAEARGTAEHCAATQHRGTGSRREGYREAAKAPHGRPLQAAEALHGGLIRAVKALENGGTGGPF